MYELTGKLFSLSFDRNGKPMVTMAFDDRQGSVAMMDELYNCEKLSIKIDKYRPKRSLSANAYLWVLCEKLADKLSEDGIPHTKQEVYRTAIKEKGIYREQGGLPIDFAKTSRHAWEMLGTGWITEQVDFELDGDNVVVRYYYGTSTYNSKQMCRVIDWLVNECRQQGIPTKTEEEIKSLLNSWGAKK